LRLAGQPRRPEPVELELPPQRQGEPASAPLPRSAQAYSRQLQADDRGVRQQSFTAILGKQRQRPRPGRAFFKHLNRSAPRQLLGIIDLAQIEYVPLHHASAGHTLVLDNAEVAVLLAVLPANRLAQEHAREITARHQRWE
jgi:hypothetical protein